jgi:ATPase family associated with various cellular activities (AAA)
MSASRHFTLYFYAAVLELLARLARECGDAAFERWPFLAGYNNQLVAQGLAGRAVDAAPASWRETIDDWERGTGEHLPLRALRERLELGHEGLVLLMTAAIVDEDPRFVSVFEHLQGDGRVRPAASLLRCWYDHGEAAAEGRAAVRRLLASGLLTAAGSAGLDAPVHVPTAIADSMRGHTCLEPIPGMRYLSLDRLLPLQQFIAPGDLRVRASRLAALLQSGDVPAVVIRGPAGSGRRTLAGAIAREMDRAALQIDASAAATRRDDDCWRLLGPLAALTAALPIVSLDVPPGEATPLPAAANFSPIVFTLGRHGGIGGALASSAVTLTLEMPGESERAEHWRSALGEECGGDLDAIVGRRMTGGHIRRAARLARASAAMDGRATVTAGDVQMATRDVGRQALEALATRLDPLRDWTRLATSSATRRELAALVARCRWRERLGAAAGPLAGGATAGVRALFTGPSGTGKTMAARLMAAELGKDIFRLDLAGLVSKFIGETEKAIDRVLSRGEELDVVLLLDEGDALLTSRTSVTTSNDRYANLETNFLLQRLESFEGILFVTTNAADRIDRAFERRMDVVVDFSAPGPAERLAIWDVHLPPEHAVPEDLVREMAVRCALSGAQIRNAVVHATLVALDRGSRVLAADVEAAVQREYAKSGAACPLRPGVAPGRAAHRDGAP